MTATVGQEMYQWAVDLFPICRSITGIGLRRTLDYFRSIIPEMEIYGVPSGTQAFDWIVPDEWEISEAFLERSDGVRVLDFSKNNLHVMGYSVPVDEWFSLNELDLHLHSLPNQPNAIPYVTSYYKRTWGFCLSHEERVKLSPNFKYRAVIRAKHFPGQLNFGEIVIPGKLTQEVFLSTYVCHPSMANNELSGPVVTAQLVKWLKTLEKPRFTYRIVFIPETIGSIVYLSRNLPHLKSSVTAGFNVSCVGDDRKYSFLPSRNGGTLSDRAAIHVLKHLGLNYDRYSFLERGSDERQYCAPGVDLPVASIMRSKYATYPEYHTSLDDLSLISPTGLEGAFTALKMALMTIEENSIYAPNVLCEPQLSKYGLYPEISTKTKKRRVAAMQNFLAYCDGRSDLLSIGEIIGEPVWELASIAKDLLVAGLIKESN